MTLCDGGCPPFALIQAISTFSLKPSVFPPLPSARQQFIYIIVYADSFLPPTRTHNDISYWCFLPFSLGSPCFYVSLSSASPLRLRSAKHPLPWIFRSISFSCMHMCMDIYIYKYMYHPVASSLHSRLIFSLMLSLSWITRAGLSALFPHRRFPERLTSVAGVAPSLGYLLLFLTVCPHKQNGGLLFLLL